MKRIRITNGYQKFSNINLLGKFRFIITSLINNAYFVNPDPPLPVLIAIADEFEQAITKSSTGAKYARAVTKSKRKEVMDTLYRLSRYVLLEAENNRLAVLSSGFNIAKQRSTPQPLEKPFGLVLSDGVNAGEIQLVFKGVKYAKGYLYQIAEGDLTEETKWTNTYGTIRKTKFTRLESGKRYWVRVIAIGTNNQMVYSDAVSRIAQ